MAAVSAGGAARGFDVVHLTYGACHGGPSWFYFVRPRQWRLPNRPRAAVHRTNGPELQVLQPCTYKASTGRCLHQCGTRWMQAKNMAVKWSKMTAAAVLLGRVLGATAEEMRTIPESGCIWSEAVEVANTMRRNSINGTKFWIHTRLHPAPFLKDVAGTSAISPCTFCPAIAHVRNRLVVVDRS